LPNNFYRRLIEASNLSSFRDLLIVPGRSEVEPSQIAIASTFSTNIRINLPFVSSPMDTVTESRMAVALARLGGLGVIHRNMSAEEQVEQAKKVKRAESFIIRDVFTISPGARVKDAIEIMTKNSISGLPVVEGERLVGILTKRDVSFAEMGTDIRSVMTKRVITAPQTVTVEEAKRTMHDHRIEKLPVVDKDGKLQGLITVKDIYSREKYSSATRDSQGRLMVAAAVSPFDLERAKALDKYVDALVSDVAHFHNSNILDAARRMAKEVSADLVIGNIGTAQALKDSVGAVERVNGVRAGIGSGSTCITSQVTKAGAPTLFAVAEIADVLEELNLKIPIIADGGIRTPGDAMLALAVGASTVMMGNVFAGCSESPGNLIKIGGKYYKPIRGMGSPSARQKRFAVDRYASMAKGIAEGVEGYVPYRGDLQIVMDEFSAGLKAALGYAGAKNIKDLWEKARFGTVSSAALEGAGVRDLMLPGD